LTTTSASFRRDILQRSSAAHLRRPARVKDARPGTRPLRLAERFRVDFNLSSKPEGFEAYAVDLLADDIRGLIRERGAESALLVGHDWGGSIAWTVAMNHPEVVDRLAILKAARAIPSSDGSPISLHLTSSSHGRFLVDGKGHALYLFEKDDGGESYSMELAPPCGRRSRRSLVRAPVAAWKVRRWERSSGTTATCR
jgi:pimeloyl-ACP methyl ester carboxylesterase